MKLKRFYFDKLLGDMIECMLEFPDDKSVYIFKVTIEQFRNIINSPDGIDKKLCEFYDIKCKNNEIIIKEGV